MVDVYTPDAKEIREKFLRDLEIGFSGAGIDAPAIEEGSEYFIMGTAVGNMASIIYAQFREILLNSSELTATDKDLDDIRIAIGLPEIVAAGGAGRIIPQINTGTPVPFPAGLEFTLNSTGLRGAVSGAQTITSGGSLKVAMIDTGTASNADPYEPIQFVSPPNNVALQGTTDLDGITGGTDAESNEQKRQRILDRRRNVPAGGNYGSAIDLAQNSTGTVQKAFCYPAITGPASLKVVAVKSMVLDLTKTREFSRELGESTLEIVQRSVLGDYPEAIEISVQTPTDEYFDAGVLLTLPSPQNGGWLDGTVFPAIEAGDSGRVTVTGITSSSQITVSAVQSTSPVLGQRISWFSPLKRRFITASITGISGSSGAWELTLDKPFAIDESSVQAGNFISPGALNISNYGEAYLAQINLLGPGENTTAFYRLPRASRRPFNAEEWSYELSAQQLRNISNAFPEILDFDYSYRSLTAPTVPALEASAPNILTPRSLAFYKL